MALLIFKFAFEKMKMKRIYSRVVILNKKVVSFQDSLEIKKIKILKNYFNYRGKKVNSIEHTMTSKDYLRVKEKLAKLSRILINR